MRFQNKVAIVTGAASGIGRAAALGFGGEGASVVIVDIRRESRRGSGCRGAGYRRRCLNEPDRPMDKASRFVLFARARGRR